ncbi:hypothetical protein [Methylobacterium sp. Leaf112]|uniref:hypothetical protein n=1 Tax=Methylobacterium sp. Leaf112 TaxID=1736258 RepID=UPI0006F4D4EA|nr:hypothetical protein [Methylobacterium sp. Leaf112]KQP62168.1 hypothetical protein ASF52_05785 [Methylobacterium sp. Leaf112]
MRALILAAALAGAGPCLAGSIPTDRIWSVAVHDDVDGLAAVDGTLYVRRLPGGIRFRLECRVSWPDGSADSRTSVWGRATVDGDIVKGRVEGGEDLVQLPDRRFELRLGDSGGAWESNVPGCPRAVRLL